MSLDSFSGGVLVGIVGSVIAFLIITLLLAPAGRYLCGRYRRFVFDKRAWLLLKAIYDRANSDPAAIKSSNGAAEQAGIPPTAISPHS
jgi:hypothetical protein